MVGRRFAGGKLDHELEKINHCADALQIVYIIIAIASFYYPNPDVATSNGVEAALQQNVTIPAHLYNELLALVGST